MADPTIVQCPADVWVLAAGAVTTGVIYILDNDPNVYRQTFRVEGQPAPTDDADAVTVRSKRLNIINGCAIDVYIKAVGKDGRVRVDL